MQSISARVDKIEGEARVQTNTPVEQSLQTNPVAQEVPGEQSSTTGTTHQLATDDGPERVEPLPSTGDKDNNAWADQDDPPEYKTIFWQPDADSDASEGETTRLSAITTKIVEDAFSRSLPNEKRRSIKRKQPVPDTPYTKCPKLDSTILSRLPRPAKDADRASTRIQTLVLDAACPLINMLESARKGTLNTKEAAGSAQQALKLLGNASANISRERKQKATQHLNPELATLVDDEESFKDAAPMLFGKTFDQRAKDHIDAIRSLKKPHHFQEDSLFRGATPQCPGEVATAGAEEHSRNPATSRPGEKLNECNLYKKINECIELYKCSKRKRKRGSKHVSRHSARSQGARESAKSHETTSVVSDARERTKPEEASKLITKGVRDHTSQHTTHCDGDAHSISQLEWGHPSNNRVYYEEDNATSHGSQPLPIICRQDQPVSIELESINQ